MIALELLNRQKLFENLPQKLLEEVRPFIRLQEFRRKDFVLHKGLEADSLLMLISGRLQVISNNEAGKDIGLRFIEPGDYFGEVGLIDGGVRSASVLAVVPSTVGFLAKTKALWLFQHQPEIAARIQKRLCTIIRDEIQFRSSLGGAKAFTRIYAVLSKNPELSQAVGPTALEGTPNQHAIASMASVSRETVSRALSALAKAGILQKDGRQLIVQNPIALRRLATGELNMNNLPEAPNMPNRSPGQAISIQLKKREAGQSTEEAVPTQPTLTIIRRRSHRAED